jgi:hypothetical protein
MSFQIQDVTINEAINEGNVDSSIPIGNSYSDYLYWDTTTSTWAVDNSTQIHLGTNAGFYGQGVETVAIGHLAGNTNQTAYATAVGSNAGMVNQAINGVALGIQAGSYNQRNSAIAIGSMAGFTLQGTGSIAIGYFAGRTNQHQNSIAINASLSDLTTTTNSALFINPIRRSVTTNGGFQALYYDPSSKEVVYYQP